ncbi:hypothetical protein ACIQ7D_24850 [Streptomyces sp. NPDC096310]|uniref:hypothetical protein n=1 Tax=Streptomyces sp. NPDC096310 TaxID=3366082 RepID=UPI00382EAE8F
MKTEAEFYASDRPPHPKLPEDRPRGGGPKEPLVHPGAWSLMAIVAIIVLVVAVGIVLFP